MNETQSGIAAQSDIRRSILLPSSDSRQNLLVLIQLRREWRASDKNGVAGARVRCA